MLTPSDNVLLLLLIIPVNRVCKKCFGVIFLDLS